MMRKIIIYLFVVVAFLMPTSCQNDGHIGWLFGVWRIAEYTVDGEAQNPPELSGTTIAFQNSIVEVVAVLDDYYSTYSTFGSWSETENTLTLNFTHSDDKYAPGTGQYAAPWWLGMTSQEPMEMAISDRKGDGFTLTWTSSEGKKIVYKLRKTW